MRFTSIPKDFTPIADGVCFTFEVDDEGDFEVQIIDDDTSEIIGIQRLYGVMGGTIDISHHICSNTPLRPTPHICSSLAPAITRRYRIEIGGTVSPSVVLSDNRHQPTLPSIATTMGHQRRIGHSYSDTLRIFCPFGSTICASICSDMGEQLDLELCAETGVADLVVTPLDFDDRTKSLEVAVTIDGTPLPLTTYTIDPFFPDETRLAWLSSIGSLEHYTFNFMDRRWLQLDKPTTRNAALEPTATHTSVECRQTLLSNLEPQAKMEALAEIIASPRVWVDDGKVYRAVEVLDPKRSSSHFGEPTCMLFDIATRKREGCLW